MEWMAWSWCIITSLFTYIRCRDRDLGEKWSLSKIFPKYASLDVYLKINHGSDKAEHSYHLAGPMQGWKAWSHVFSYFQCYCIHCIPWLLPLGGELHHLCFHVTIRPCLSSWFLYSLSLSLSLSLAPHEIWEQSPWLTHFSSTLSILQNDFYILDSSSTLLNK